MWHALEINGDRKCLPIWSPSLAIKTPTFKMHSSKVSHGSFNSRWGNGAAGSKSVSFGRRLKDVEECGPGYHLKQDLSQPEN